MIILYVLQIVYFVVYIFVLYLLRFEGLYKIVQSNLYSAPWYNDFRIEKSCDAPNLLNDRDLVDNEPEFEETLQTAAKRTEGGCRRAGSYD